MHSGLPEKESVAVNGATELLVAMTASKPEKIAIRLTLQTDVGDFFIPLVGTAQLRIDATRDVVDLRANQDFVDVTLRVLHPEIDPRRVGMLVSGQEATRIKVEADEVKFRINASGLKTDTLLRLVPVVDGDEHRPIQLRVTRKGIVRLATDKVFGQRKEDGEFHFRLFLVGDMSVLEPDLTEASLESDREPMKAAIQIRMLRNSAILTCRVQTQHEFDGDVVTLVVGDQSFTCTLRTQ